MKNLKKFILLILTFVGIASQLQAWHTYGYGDQIGQCRQCSRGPSYSYGWRGYYRHPWRRYFWNRPYWHSFQYYW